MKLLEELDFTKHYTYADYLLWNFKERLELIKGKVFKMPPAPSSEHQEISFELTGIFYNFFRHRPCKVFAAPFDVRLQQKHEQANLVETVVQPDLCVVCDLKKIDKAGCQGAPDLVVEILSPGNSHKEMKEKFEVYEEAGVREYWLVNPLEKHILVFVQNEKGRFTGLQPVVIGQQLVSHIFPELRVVLDDIFPGTAEVAY